MFIYTTLKAAKNAAKVVVPSDQRYLSDHIVLSEECMPVYWKPWFQSPVRHKPKPIKLELYAAHISAQHLWDRLGEVKCNSMLLPINSYIVLVIHKRLHTATGVSWARKTDEVYFSIVVPVTYCCQNENNLLKFLLPSYYSEPYTCGKWIVFLLTGVYGCHVVVMLKSEAGARPVTGAKLVVVHSKPKVGVYQSRDQFLSGETVTIECIEIGRASCRARV